MIVYEIVLYSNIILYKPNIFALKQIDEDARKHRKQLKLYQSLMKEVGVKSNQSIGQYWTLDCYTQFSQTTRPTKSRFSVHAYHNSDSSESVSTEDCRSITERIIIAWGDSGSV
ncbi:uncharacterized protein LOC107883953 [Acyrthosiphon pisum]|uniref:Uncharacterized protein n=1 Tax=Acyrthosiphon pisum TaxID=7029 RepID=A0A8R2JVD5_ACYPI|nr:uncharacterized protein LOC107883953 [Acyrthosiphon pisum]|eukprot:XP_016660554.1 PREDICTED: uncharacterized protein LOC107883953 [Acyrthosiphon pisum]